VDRLRRIVSRPMVASLGSGLAVRNGMEKGVLVTKSVRHMNE
jgi:hypothetical protein